MNRRLVKDLNTFFSGMILATIIILLCFSFIAESAPNVKFTAKSVENKVTLTPILNSEVSRYKWSVIGKRSAPDFETDWTDYEDASDHIGMWESGTYFVTIIGESSTGVEVRFTNQVKVSVKEPYVKPEKQEIPEEKGSLIIDNLPEPLKTFLKDRSDLELALIVIGSILLVAVTTRRKKIKKYVKLERYHGKE